MANKRNIFEEVGSDTKITSASAGAIARAGSGDRHWVRLWLWSLVGLIIVMITVGGLTRLTDSGLSITEWALLILALAVVISAEMFNKVMIELGRLIPGSSDDSPHNCLKIATAAVFVTMSGTMLAVGLIFARHLWLMFQA